MDERAKASHHLGSIVPDFSTQSKPITRANHGRRSTAALAASRAWGHRPRSIYSRGGTYRAYHSADAVGSTAGTITVPQMDRNGHGSEYCRKLDDVESGSTRTSRTDRRIA